MAASPIIDATLAKAAASFQNGKLAEAESLCQEVLTTDPRHAEGLCLLGSIRRQQGNVSSALQCFLQALNANPQSARTHHDVGVVMGSLNRFEEAVAFLRHALAMQPRFPEACLSLGELCLRWAHVEESIQWFRQALAQDGQLIAAREGLEQIDRESQELNALVTRLQTIRSPETRAASIGQPEPLKLPRRELFPRLLNKLGLTGGGVEVGVQRGSFSELFLRQWKGGLLYSVDPWREFRAADYADVANVSQAQHDEFYRSTLQRLMPFQARSVVWRMTSKEASGLIRDQALDFCYLDGDHSQRGVREDLELWYPKVKPGGILGGHDYIPDGTYAVGVFGVQSAVQEFVKTAGLRGFVSAEPDDQFPSWFLLKP